jgi:hypothetical protein
MSIVAQLLNRTLKQVANHRLRCIAPIIADHGIEHEQKHFDEKLLSGELTLARTCAWLRDTIRKMVVTGVVVLCDLPTTRGSKSYTSIHEYAITQFITGGTSVSVAECPEVLLLDVSRLSDMNTSFHRLVQTATVLVVVAQRLGELKFGDIPTFLETLSSRITTTTNDIAAVITAVCDEVEVSFKVGLGELSSIRKTLFDTIAADKPVPVLLSQRLSKMILAGVSFGAVDTLAADSTAKIEFKTFHIPAAVLSLAPQFRKLIAELRMVIGVNAKVHGDRYNDIISSESTDMLQTLGV